jgi:hypothetical protein
LSKHRKIDRLATAQFTEQFSQIGGAGQTTRMSGKNAFL